MEDPAHACLNIQNANNADSNNPDWRFCGLGLIQIREPPYTFWPGGIYEQILQDAQSRKFGPDIQRAKDCNPTSFNPFNTVDNLCAGTKEIEKLFIKARNYVAAHHSLLNWDSATPEGIEKDNVITAYIALMDYRGFWESSIDPNNPKTKTSIDRLDKEHICGDKYNLYTPSACWFEIYYDSWRFGTAYCTDNPDSPNCNHGKVRGDGDLCYGFDDPVKFLDTCFVNKDPASKELANYYQLRDNCANSYCPAWKKIYENQTAQWRAKNPIPKNSQNPYAPDK